MILLPLNENTWIVKLIWSSYEQVFNQQVRFRKLENLFFNDVLLQLTRVFCRTITSRVL